MTLLDFKDLTPLAAEHALGLVVLFGSRARHAERPGSDFDLGVLRRDGGSLGHRALASLQADLSRRTGADVDLADLAGADAVFRYEVVSSGRPLFEAEPGLWAEFTARTLIDWDEIAPFVRACVAGVGRAALAAGRS